MTPARDLLSQYLGQLQARGVTHVAVDREVLGSAAKATPVVEKVAVPPVARVGVSPPEKKRLRW